MGGLQRMSASASAGLASHLVESGTTISFGNIRSAGEQRALGRMRPEFQGPLNFDCGLRLT
jgi:hypothetical protein